MKKLLCIFCAAAMAAMPVSCVYEIEDVFEQSASQRISAKVSECADLLTSAEHGWLIQYYPGTDRAYGGSTYAARFGADGNVEVAWEKARTVSETQTSHYTVNMSSSVVLTFDTYNDYIHYWSDPDYFSGNDYGGDFEFAYVGGDSRQLEFRGIKTGNRIVFTALETDIVSAIESISDIRRQYYVSYDVNGETLESDGEYNVLYCDVPSEDNPEYYVEASYPFAYSTTGIVFYEPVEIGGVTMQNLVWNSDSEVFVASDAIDGSGASVTVEVKGSQSPDYIAYDDFPGTYEMAYDGGETMQVEITSNGDYSTLNMLMEYGANTYTFVLGWYPDGHLTMTTQYVGMENDEYYIWFCPYSSDNYLAYAETYGFNLVNNGGQTDGGISLAFEDNGVWSRGTSSISLYRFTSPTTASSATRVSRLLLLEDMETLTKTN